MTTGPRAGTDARMACPPTLIDLAQIMARLRDPVVGCAWDRAQDFASIAPYTIEEAYEVAEAIANGDMAALQDELGDLLLQVVFHARMAEEAGQFTLADVIASICAKMERRHPHINSAEAARDATTQKAEWEAIKAAERAAADRPGQLASALAGVALALPALMRAEKLQSRAARVGFDWPDSSGPGDKVVEELAELAAASDAASRLEEAGDLLFAAVNLVRHHDLSAETALRAGNAKFDRRFRAMEAAAGGTIAGIAPADQDALWRAVKAQGL